MFIKNSSYPDVKFKCIFKNVQYNYKIGRLGRFCQNFHQIFCPGCLNLKISLVVSQLIIFSDFDCLQCFRSYIELVIVS